MDVKMVTGEPLYDDDPYAYTLTDDDPRPFDQGVPGNY
jgi:hypothetical protein